MKVVMDGHYYMVQSYNVTGKTSYVGEKRGTGSKRDARKMASAMLSAGASHVNINVRLEICTKGKAK